MKTAKPKKPAPPPLKKGQVWLDKATAKQPVQRTITLVERHEFATCWHARSEWSDGRHNGRLVVVRETNVRNNFRLKADA